MPYSIRQRLLVFILSLTFISWSLVAIINYFNARSEIEELFDAHLIQSAKVLLSLVEQELYEQEYDAAEEFRLKDVEHHLARHKYEKLLAFQISVTKDDFSFRSAQAPEEPLSGNRDGFSDNLIGNVHWRVYTLHDPLKVIVIRVAEPHSVRAHLINEIALSLLLPLLIGFPVITLLIWKCVSAIFRPLDKIAADIRQRNPEQLDPVSGFNVPKEVQPLITALNKLFYRLDRIIQNERRFTADAAHELRTPLAGLKTQAQIALRTQEPEKREHALLNILKSVDRATHLIEQLLTLARLEPGVEIANYENFDLAQLVREALEDVATSARGKNISIDFRDGEPVQIHANANTLSMLLRNLLDNAIRYTPGGGTVRLDLQQDSSGITLTIEDNGPGIPPGCREDVFKRFFRTNETWEHGSGLGLSIVKQIADSHNAAITLGESPENGLKVDIFFPSRTRSINNKG
jgi:two-component system sensor histidine kinase QseC